MSKTDNNKSKVKIIGTKAYIGFNQKQLKELLTDTCKKCKHLIDDHRGPDLTIPKNMKLWKKKKVYQCMYCECKIT